MNMVRKSIRLAQAIEDTIRSKGITRSQFAAMMGVQPSIVTKWLSGSHNFTIDTLFRIEVALEKQIIHIIKN